jgi:hypothetical protein
MSYVDSILCQSPREEGAINNGPMAGKMGPIAYQNKPPNKNRALENFEYLQHLEIDSAYIPTRCMTESGRAYRRCIYNILANYLQAETNARGMRIEKPRTDTNWRRVWKNLWMTPVSKATKEQWYNVIHDIIPTRARLHVIRITQMTSAPRVMPRTRCNIASLTAVRGVHNGRGQRVGWRS